MPDMAWASSVPVKAGAWFLAAHMILLPSAVVGETTLDVDLSGILAERFSGGPPTDKGLQLRGKYIYTGERFELHAEGRVRWNEAYANTSRYSEAARDAYRFEGFKSRVAVYIERTQSRREALWTRPAPIVGASI
jgi:hypothetical protein